MLESIKTLRGANPRRNLPIRFTRKRTESNFLCAFERAYKKTSFGSGISGRDLEVSGYGIPDWLWFSWTATNSSECTALNIQTLPPPARILAFELKIHDWRKAIEQAFRYSYFADIAIVVLPPKAAEKAKLHIGLFHSRKIGLWAFDQKTGIITKVFTPETDGARSSQAKAKALNLILHKVDFCKLREKN